MMNSHYPNSMTALVGLLIVVASCGAIPVHGQDASLPENWQSLPVAEFVPLVQTLDAEGLLPADLREQVHQHAATLLESADYALAGTEGLPLLEGLQQLGWKRLGADGRLRIINQVLARQDDWTDRPYEEVRAKVMLLNRGKQNMAAFVEGRRWVQAGGSVEKARQSPLGVADLKQPLAALAVEALLQGGEPIYREVDLKWEGSITVPATGDYTFSVSPVNINADYGLYQMRQDTRVWLANQEIITATHQQWAPASQAISLAADQSVVLRVEMQFAFNPTQYEHGVPHLLLYWERPGVARSIVPSSAFKKPANADGSGLQGTYRWRGTDGRLHSIVQTDASLDFIWPLRGLPRIGNRVGESPQMLLMVRGYWREMIAPEKLVEMEQAGHIHPLILGGAEIAGSLSSGQREELLDALLARPALFTAADPKAFWRFYRAFHVSAPEKTTEMFGVWAAAHADDACIVSPGVSFWGVSQELRTTCREIATCVFHELPQLATALQSHHLELPDGRCALPVGYTLNYGYLTTGRLAEWLELLDAKLDDLSLSGDQRVNWLLLRAHAEEIRNGPRRPYFQFAEQVLHGRRWLEEALAVASSAEAKARVAGELAARLARVGKFAEARQLLASSPTPDDQAAAQRLADNRAAVDRAEQVYEADRQAQAASGGSP